jgi:hypothetical protein
MISRLLLGIAAVTIVCGSTLPAGAEDAGIGVGPVGVTVGSDHDRDRHKTVIIKHHRDRGDHDTVVIKKDRDRD